MLLEIRFTDQQSCEEFVHQINTGDYLSKSPTVIYIWEIDYRLNEFPVIEHEVYELEVEYT